MMSRENNPGVPLRQWVGVKRVIPALLVLFFPSMRDFFSYIEGVRLAGREGGISHEEARMVCGADGVFSSGYAAIVGTPLLLLQILLVDFLSIYKAELIISPLVLVAGSSFLATALVECSEHVRVLILEKMAKSRGFRLIGPAAYFFLYIASFMFLLSFFLLS